MKLMTGITTLVLATAGTGAHAVGVTVTGEFLMYDPAGGQMDTNDAAPGLTAHVTGVIDEAAGTLALASTDTFFSLNWSTSNGMLFGPGTHTVSTAEAVCGGGVACGGDYTFTVGAGQLGAQIDFAYGGTTGIDVVMVWDVTTDGLFTYYQSTDWDGDGILGGRMLEGPFPGFSANFNIAAVPEASTYAMMLAGLGLVGFMARRRGYTAA